MMPDGKPVRLIRRQKGSLIFKQRLIIAAASCLLLIGSAAILYFNLGNTHKAHAAVAGDYRSFTSGSWNIPGTWEKYNGTTWDPALTAPSSIDGTITIQNTHTVNLTASVSVDQLVIDNGGVMNILTGILTIVNGSGSDMSISGTVSQNTGGTLTIAAGSLVTVLNGGTFSHNGGTRTLTGWAINDGGTYIHNVNNINVPTALWGAASTLNVRGVTNANLKGMNQAFGNIIYNCTSQTGYIEFWESITSIAGNLTVMSTGTGSVIMQRASTLIPLNIGGNILQSGGTFYMTKGAAFTCNLAGTFTLNGGTFIEVERYGVPVLNVYGLFTINNGTFNHSTYSGILPNEGIGIVNLYNNYFRSGGLHTETATGTGRGEFNFAKTGTQTYTYTGGSVTNTVNFTVNSGAILDMADYILTGGGSFTLSSGGGLIMASVNGISVSGATGNIQVTGTRNYSTVGDYTYNATAAQITGNGLPAVIHNLTVNNSSNVTMTVSSSATNIITIIIGKIITGINELGSTNTNPAGITGYTDVSYVVGNLRRSTAATGSYDYPVGTITNYEFANLTLNGVSGFTDILGYFENSDPLEAAFPLGTALNSNPIVELLNYGYWSLTPSSPMSGGIYTITLKEKGHTNPAADPFEYCVLKRPGLGSPWASIGAHNNNTQSEIGGVATAARSELTAFSHFAIGRGTVPLPVTLIKFEPKVSGNTVVCSWQTVAEVNNNYFTLERSQDGYRFEELKRIAGAGTNSNGRHYSYTDLNPLQGTSYYRLKQTDYDGTTEAFPVRSVKRIGNLPGLKSISVFPNQIQEEFSVQFDAEESGEAEIFIISLTGTIIFKQQVTVAEGKNAFSLNFPSSATPGTYMLKIKNDVLALPAVKIIKQ